MKIRPITLAALLLAAVLAFSFASPVFASSPTTATFSGTASVHIVLVDGTQMTLPFSVVATAGGPGVGTLFLTLGPGLPSPFPGTVTVGGFVATGSVTIPSTSASGGGTITQPEASQEGFGVTSSGGQFQCQNAGFSALLSMGIRQMDVHGSAAPASLTTS